MLVLTFCNDEDLEVSGEAVHLEDASAVVENLVTGPAGICPVVPEMHCCEEELILLVVASLIPVCNPRRRYTRSSAGDGELVSFLGNVEFQVPLNGFCVSVCVCVCGEVNVGHTHTQENSKAVFVSAHHPHAAR